MAALCIALLTGAAQAQGSGRGKRQQQTEKKVEDTAKKKALDEDYKNALKTIPAPSEKPDPWKTMR